MPFMCFKNTQKIIPYMVSYSMKLIFKIICYDVTDIKMDLSINTKCVIAAVRVHSVASLVSLCDPGDCSPPDSSVHRTFQTRILEGLPFPSPRDLPDPGIEPGSPAATALQALFFFFFNFSISILF